MVKDENESANRPDNTAFTQQRLPAWQPMLSAGIVIPGFVLIGLAFIGIGVALFITSRSIQVLELDYTGMEQDSPCFRCSNADLRDCVCSIRFSINSLFEGPVFFYYGLSNYFQNYRRYGVSRDDNQLYGDLTYFKKPFDQCEPYRYDSNNQPIVPCGSVANSMFNDTFTLFQNVNDQQVVVPLDGKGIAWWTDYNIKFRNPSITPLRNAFNGTAKPLFWSRPAYELDPSDPANNGFINQDFLVWMRTAALPDFRKLYRRITEGNYANGLPAGNYTLEIAYNYPVLSFNGRKKVVFSNVSWMGGKNEFLGIAYLVIGSLCVVMSVVMLIVYAKFKFPEED
ncbi:cell cycle control protein 50B isoform X1 [Phyllopteryx taeniolatus]|uniref:cell cycle control protein 50B isoform X1 n=1 Tax=Phyllopteryx taeniolatus TaxID=161469 RepID=UPI002AD2F029|nr:cell cycle control protein 50B isoform X1 [Phyllopteryx taeniolatus]XP_061652126.1 cell cycle control protein 50B isoform X1 [Phyllopteryx taeniolatus]